MAKSIGVCLISRDKEKVIPACLESVRPYVQQIVVGVDELTEDKTAEVAKASGADIVVPVKVSEWHECKQHGKVLAQHFANARNEVWKNLDPALDFYLWIDSDDILKGGEFLQLLCEEIGNSDAIGAWFPYHYATMKEGTVTNTLFHRERLLRTKMRDGSPVHWEWRHRVHENIVPDSKSPPQWIVRDNPAVYHQEGGHDLSLSVRRNILLLEMDLEENPQDSRAIFYMGNQYFAIGNMSLAIHYYEQLAAIGKNQYEMWQSWCYCSLAYERLGNLGAATEAAFRAIDLNPKHPEPYYRLASIALLAGNFEQCEFWTKQASITEAPPPKEAPPFFVFKNPLDYNFNSKMPLADALASQGRIKEARGVLQEAYKALPDERVKEAIEHYQSLERAEEKASGFVRLMDGRSDEQVVDFWEKLNLDDKTKQFGRVRARVMPIYLKHRRGLVPRAIFYCGRTMEEWSPESPHSTGIGGSETAVIEIAKRLSKDGWSVDVYNGAGRYEGEYDSIGYWDPERLGSKDSCDLFVAWRNPEAYKAEIKARIAILWCHDLNHGAPVKDAMQAWGRIPNSIVCGVSQWHADYLKQVYEIEKTDFLPNGIDLSRFSHFETKEGPRKIPFQCVYASSADRGLERLLTLWPRVLLREPGATLKIAYGWQTIDGMISTGKYSNLQDLKNRILYLSEATPDVKKSVQWVGRLNQKDLADLYTQSEIWAYPTSFLEVSCISAMEAMAGACVPVSSTAGALPETVQDAGFLVPGQPDTKIWKATWLDVFLGTLASPQLRNPKAVRGMQRALDLTWDKAYDKWKEVIDRLNSSKPELISETAAG